MALSTAQQIRLVLVQQQGKLEINTPQEIDTWVNYVLQGLPGGTGTIQSGAFITQ